MLCETVHPHRHLPVLACVAGFAVTLEAQLARKTAAWAAVMAQEWEQQLKRTGPSKSGEMNNRTTSSSTRNTATVTVDTDYAHIVAYGASPHQIVARPGGMLAFPNQAGQTIYRRSVNHPGVQRPNRWWVDAIEMVPEMAQRAWNAVS